MVAYQSEEKVTAFAFEIDNEIDVDSTDLRDMVGPLH